MKRKLLLILLSVMSLFLLIACSSGKEQSEGKNSNTTNKKELSVSELNEKLVSKEADLKETRDKQASTQEELARMNTSEGLTSDGVDFIYEGETIVGVDNSGEEHKVIERITIGDGKNESMQSFSLDEDTKSVYKIGGATQIGRLAVFNYDGTVSRGESAETYMGHRNDSDYVDGSIYVTGPHDSDDSNLFKMDLATKSVHRFDTSFVTNNENGSTRRTSGVTLTDYSTADELYLVTYDQSSDLSDSQWKEDDKLVVYKYNATTGENSIVLEDNRDFIYIQGSTTDGSYLYVAVNLKIEGRPLWYAGIGVKIYDLSTGKLVDQINFLGDFEAEGLESQIVDGTTKIYMGVVKYGYLAKIVEFDGLDNKQIASLKNQLDDYGHLEKELLSEIEEIKESISLKEDEKSKTDK